MRTLKTLVAPFDPLRSLPDAIAARAWVFPLLVTMGLTALGSAVLASRIDPSAAVYAKLEAAGELTKVTDREISEQIEQARRIGIVGGAAKGLVVVPLLALLSALATWLFLKLLALRIRFVEAMTVVCLAALPMGFAQGVTLASALRQNSLSPSMAKTLVPSALTVSPPEGPPSPSFFKRTAPVMVAGLVDFFHVWSALLFGFGLSSATGRTRWLLVPSGAALYFLVMAAVLVGLPGVLEGSSGPRR
jgi:hypothetical protein